MKRQSGTSRPLYLHCPSTILSKWSQLSDSAFLDRVNGAKIPLFYGLVKHFSRTPPNPSSTPNLLAILLAIAIVDEIESRTNEQEKEATKIFHKKPY